MFSKCLENVRSKAPLVHCITNYVTVNDVANVILACGASPVMADDPCEAGDITAICDGLCVNIGTLNSMTIEAMRVACARAQALKHPMVLDPVGAGASRLRTDTARKLLDDYDFTAVRGNMSEIKALASGSNDTRGVDCSGLDAVCKDNLDDAVGFVSGFAARENLTVAVTGAIDIVSDGRTSIAIYNGRPEMGRITGTGCQLSGMTTAYVAADMISDAGSAGTVFAVAAAVSSMGVCGETAYANLKEGEGNATYRNRIIDAVYSLSGEELDGRCRYEIR